MFENCICTEYKCEIYRNVGVFHPKTCVLLQIARRLAAKRKAKCSKTQGKMVLNAM